jgi:hypothetical protein
MVAVKRTVTTEQVARWFVAALKSSHVAAYEAVLAEDVGVRAWCWDSTESHRPRKRVIEQLMGEWASWPAAWCHAMGSRSIAASICTPGCRC